MWNWSNNWWWRHDRKSPFRVIFACGRTWYDSFKVQLVLDLHRPKEKLSLNVYTYFSMLFYQTRLGGTNWHVKPMPVILIFSATRD